MLFKKSMVSSHVSCFFGSEIGKIDPSIMRSSPNIQSPVGASVELTQFPFLHNFFLDEK